MAYTAEISRNNPSCFLFVIDQSGSMSDNFGNQEFPKRKAEGVSDAINRLLQNLVIKCAKSEGVRDYYYVGVIGYGVTVGPAFSGALVGKELVPISEIANNPARIEERNKKVDDGAGGLIDQKVKFPIWFDPIANGGTPMTEGFRVANKFISDFIAQHPSCFPPVIIHITDGESTDGNPTSEMKSLLDKASDDGNVLLFNLHLSSRNTQAISFPDNASNLPDEYAKMLFETASSLTPFMRNIAKQDYALDLSDGAKGFVLNGDLSLVITALDIGTRPSNLR
jgi:hypothetical protein